MSEYYHVCQVPLEVGSIILPGNYGRILSLYSANNGNIPMLYREDVLEIVRAAKYPDKPSRLKSCFVLQSPGEAAVYRNMRAQTCLIYKVIFKIENCIKHIGHWDCVYPDSNLPFYTTMRNVADLYWNGTYNGQDRNSGKEVLAESPIEIIEKI